jgi:hypothetical protein
MPYIYGKCPSMEHLAMLPLLHGSELVGGKYMVPRRKSTSDSRMEYARFAPDVISHWAHVDRADGCLGLLLHLEALLPRS